MGETELLQRIAVAQERAAVAAERSALASEQYAAHVLARDLAADERNAKYDRDYWDVLRPAKILQDEEEIVRLKLEITWLRTHLGRDKGGNVETTGTTAKPQTTDDSEGAASSFAITAQVADPGTDD